MIGKVDLNYIILFEIVISPFHISILLCFNFISNFYWFYLFRFINKYVYMYF